MLPDHNPKAAVSRAPARGSTRLYDTVPDARIELRICINLDGINIARRHISGGLRASCIAEQLSAPTRENS
jgi:hypothetical protein